MQYDTHATFLVAFDCFLPIIPKVMSLKQKGIKAEYMGSTQTNYAVVKDARSGKLNIVYMTPEKALKLPQR
jgi:ATP-dependent DNA helicase RecQ